MSDLMRSGFAAGIKDFCLPAYNEIPDVGLYLDQTVKYINGYFAPFPDMELTASMVSNYVKKGLVSNPVKKQYSREQISYLIYISIAKVSVSIDNINLMLQIQQDSYPTERAYEYFRNELKNVMDFVFGFKDRLDNVGEEDTEQKFLLRKAVIAFAYKMYLDIYFAALKRAEKEKDLPPKAAGPGGKNFFQKGIDKSRFRGYYRNNLPGKWGI